MLKLRFLKLSINELSILREWGNFHINMTPVFVVLTPINTGSCSFKSERTEMLLDIEAAHRFFCLHMDIFHFNFGIPAYIKNHINQTKTISLI